jgi:hypothetical protein
VTAERKRDNHADRKAAKPPVNNTKHKLYHAGQALTNADLANAISKG